MLSFVWALKRQEYQHLAVYSTALQWLYRLLFHCHGCHGKLDCLLFFFIVIIAIIFCVVVASVWLLLILMIIVHIFS